MNLHAGRQTERDIFILVIVFTLLRFATPSVFPTLDGPSHLANANFIKILLLQPDGFLLNFYTLNPVPVPNWTTHALIAFLLLFLPAWLAEKAVLFLLVIGFPLAFRKLVITIAPEKSYMSFLVFPFTLSSFLFFGFFNFCISVIFFLLSLDFWLNNHNKPLNIRFFLILFILVTLTYFSHILSYGLLLLFITIHILSVTGLQENNDYNTGNQRIKTIIKRLLVVTLLAAPTILPGLMFFFTSGESVMTWKPVKDLATDLLIIKPLIKFNADNEQRFTTLLSVFLFCLLLAGVFLRMRKKDKGVIWLPLIIAVMTILYFFLPDSIGSASFTNQRIGLYIYITLILFLATFPFPRLATLVIIPAGFILHYTIFHSVKNYIREMEPFAKQCYDVSAHIRPNTVVLPVDLMDNWFTGHFADYAVTGTAAAMVYNYESEAGYFPVLTNRTRFPRLYIGDPAIPEKSVIFSGKTQSPLHPIDYILLMQQYPGKASSQSVTPWFMEKLTVILKEHYKLAFHAGHCKLYERKSD
jgi:hypothetical protein